MFDKDRSGFASSSEIKTVMANLGVHFSDEEIQEMMIEVSFKDFLPLFAFNLNVAPCQFTVYFLCEKN